MFIVSIGYLNGGLRSAVFISITGVYFHFNLCNSDKISTFNEHFCISSFKSIIE